MRLSMGTFNVLSVVLSDGALVKSTVYNKATTLNLFGVSACYIVCLICLAWPEFSLIFSLNWLKVCGAQWDNTLRKMSKTL